MTKPTDIRITSVRPSTQHIDYRTPIKFGGRVVTSAVLLNVVVDVETRDGRTGRGVGSMPMGNVWGWPSPTLTGEQTLQAMLDTAANYNRSSSLTTEPAGRWVRNPRRLTDRDVSRDPRPRTQPVKRTGVKRRN